MRSGKEKRFQMAAGIIGKKVGMTRVFTDNGEQIPVTVLEVGPCTIIGKRTPETDKYSAIRVGFGKRKASRITQPRAGEAKKANVDVPQFIREFRVTEEELANYEIGQVIKADAFEKGQIIDLVGWSKGKGFAGVVKKFKVGGHVATHGSHEAFRHIGSIGQRKSPGRVFKNKTMPGRLGNDRKTIQNLEIVGVDAENNILLVGGSVPGAPNGLVMVKPSKKLAIRTAHKANKK